MLNNTQTTPPYITNQGGGLLEAPGSVLVSDVAEAGVGPDGHPVLRHPGQTAGCQVIQVTVGRRAQGLQHARDALTARLQERTGEVRSPPGWQNTSGRRCICDVDP